MAATPNTYKLLTAADQDALLAACREAGVSGATAVRMLAALGLCHEVQAAKLVSRLEVAS